MTPEQRVLRFALAGGDMSLLDHLKELRNRVVISAFAVVIGILVCLFFWQTIVGDRLESIGGLPTILSTYTRFAGGASTVID